MIQHLFYSWLLQARNASYVFFKTLGIKTNVRISYWPAVNVGFLLCLSILSMFAVTAQAQILPTGNYANLTRVGSKLFFTATSASGQPGLWKMDASPASPTLVKTVTASQLTAVGSNLYFSANEQETSYELWKTDGTPAGTMKLKDVPLQLPLSEYDYDTDLATFRASVGLKGTDNLLYFTANNAIYDYELWRTDGTAAGTFKVMKVAVEPKYYDEPTAYNFRSVANALYFTVTNTAVTNTGIYKTEGDPQSTILIKQAYSPQVLSPVNGIMYFKGESSGQNQLWKTSGTAASTILVKDLGPGFDIEENVGAGNNLYFRSNSFNTTGYELWKSDGTAAGTRLVKDIYPGSQHSYPSSLTNVSGTLYFAAYTDTYGHALWKSDGTEAGTTLVKDPFPGSSYNLQLFYLINVNNTLYFITRSESGDHILWKSDGTEAGTVKIKSITGDIGNLININSGLYFTVTNGTASLLWKSDGTEAGTVPVETSTNQALNKQWDKTFGSGNNDALTTAIRTSDGGYLLGGTSDSDANGDKSQNSKGGNDYWIVKLNSNGEKLWDKTFGGNSNDNLQSIIQTTDGSYLLAGTSTSGAGNDKTHPNKGYGDFWVIKINSSGVKQWDQTFGSTDDDFLYKIIPTADGHFLLCGGSAGSISGDKSEVNRGDMDFWVIKMSANGVKLWDKTFGGDYIDNLRAITQDANGNFLLTGSSYSGISGDKTEANRGGYDYWLVKISNTGVKLWDKTLGGSADDGAYSIFQTRDGGYLLGGHSLSDNSGNKTEPSRGGLDMWVLKLTSNGVVEWDRSFGGNSNENAFVATPTADGGYLLGTSSESSLGFDLTEETRGSNDFWLVKIKNCGEKVWDKRFGGTSADILRSLILHPDGSYILAGSSASDAGYDKSQNSKGAADYWLLKTSIDEPIPACGSIARDLWTNVPGYAVSAIPVNTTPASSTQLPSFEAPSNAGDKYGQRIRGYIHPTGSGNYTFYIAGDDNCELWLSTDDDPAKKIKIAHITGNAIWAGSRTWTKYASQKSAVVTLQAGKKYYIEALHKENTGNDNLAVGWQTPTQATISVIAGSYLSPYIPQGAGKISREFWASVTGYQISNIPLITPATTTDELTIFETAANQNNYYGQRFRGYLHPQVSGNYRFFVAGDDKAELYLSSDEDPSKKVKIASVTAPTSLRQWNKYASQQSALIALVAGRKYYIEALHKENTGDDNLSVGWQVPSQTTIAVIAGAYLSPFLASPISSIARVGVQESLESKVSLYPNPFESKLTLSTRHSGKHYITVVDNLGRTVYQSAPQMDGAETTLDLTHLKVGVYIVKVLAEDGSIQVSRVVKK